MTIKVGGLITICLLTITFACKVQQNNASSVSYNSLGCKWNYQKISSTWHPNSDLKDNKFLPVEGSYNVVLLNLTDTVEEKWTRRVSIEFFEMIPYKTYNLPSSNIEVNWERIMFEGKAMVGEIKVLDVAKENVKIYLNLREIRMNRNNTEYQCLAIKDTINIKNEIVGK